jgi:undecaprenyl diphosphate synthase
MPLPAARTEPDALPRHVAIIMDGNGRWAASRNQPRAFGHRQGVEALRATVEAAGELGIGCLTVFAFSTENWRRPPDEVSALMDLLRLYVNRDLDRLERDGVRVRIIGAREGLSPDIMAIIERAQARTAHNTSLLLQIAFNYGGQAEILAAARRIAADAKAGLLDPDAITPAAFEAYLETDGLPQPDLLIRTSGEKRLSNFMLWQTAYAELVFLDVLWPDFRRQHLEAALAAFRQRERRYGGVNA